MTVQTAALATLGDRALIFSSRESWLSARDVGHRIGGSDIAKILGVSPYGSQWDVWNRKKLGLSKVFTAAQLADFERGHRWESLVVEDYAKDSGVDVWATEDLLIEHASERWVVGSPDGLILDAGELGGLEAKTDRDRKLWGESGQVIEAWEDGAEAVIRPDYALQVYWYLEASGLPFWDIAVAIPQSFDFPELRSFRVMRDEAIQGRILNKVGEWRERFLLGDEEPDPDGSDAAKAALLARFPGRGDKVVRLVDGQEEEDLLELVAVKAEIKALERRKGVLSQKVCGAIGQDYGITLGKGKALWTPTKGRATFDAKTLKKDHPELAAEYAGEGKPYRALRLYGFDN